MTLEDYSDNDLHAELNRRRRERGLARQQALGPCPTCGAPFVFQNVEMVNEHRSAPKWKGWPAPPPPEYVETIGGDYVQTLRCENGHETITEETRFFEKENR